MNPKISVITIAYNCGKEIESTIISVIHQQYTNKEYILIDGGSTDNTMSIVGKYRQQIDVVISEKDRGRSDAFNKGIQHATGDYIVMINAGDLLTENALQTFAENYREGYDVIKGHTIRWEERTNCRTIERPVIRYHGIPFNFLVCHQSTYISREAYKKYGCYDVNLHIAMDLDLMLRFTRKGAKFMKIGRELAVFRMGGISQSSGKKRHHEMLQVLEKNGRNGLQIFTFSIYLHLRTLCRNILNMINPDLKNRIIEHVS